MVSPLLYVLCSVERSKIVVEALTSSLTFCYYASEYNGGVESQAGVRVLWHKGMRFVWNSDSEHWIYAPCED